MNIIPRPRVEISANGTDVFDPSGELLMHLDPPDDFTTVSPPDMKSEHDRIYIDGYNMGFAHAEAGLAPWYKEGDIER